MNRKFPMLGVIGAGALLFSTGSTLAQSPLDRTQLSDAPPPAADIRMADGRVVDLERRPDLVTMLRLDDGTSLTVPPEGAGPGEEARIGNEVVARYFDRGGERITTHLRVIEVQTP